MGKHRAARNVALLAASAIAILACGLQLGPPAESGSVTALSPQPVQPSRAPAEPAIATSTTQPATATESSTAAATETSGPPPVVTVTASGGRLNIRRGPGPEYDTVGSLLQGKVATASARTEDGSWVYINAPGTSTALGWITLKTQYTTVGGSVAGLQVLTAAPALPAYIQNCTPHEMLVTPGGSILLDRSTAPENQLQYFPGEYEVIDQTTDSTVANVTVSEGTTVDIKKDSSGKSFSCP